MRTRAISYIISILLGFTGLGLTTNMDNSAELNNDGIIFDQPRVPNSNNITEVPNNGVVPPTENGSPLNNNATTENNTTPPGESIPPANVTPAPSNNTQTPSSTTPAPSNNTQTPSRTTPAPSNTIQPPSNTTGAIDAQGDYLARVEEEIFAATNNERAKVGLQPLKRNGTANGYARSKSLEMLNLNYFDHNSPKNGYISAIAKKNGWDYSRIGENIYTMTGSNASSASGAAITTSWMSSEGHRANILNTGYSDIGIGVTYRNNKLYATQIFYTP